MKRGTVWQRHTATCPKVDGRWAPHKCRGAWSYTIDGDRDATGKRRQLVKGGFATKRDAQLALQRRLTELQSGIDVPGRLSIGEYLGEWITARRDLRPSTAKAYREHVTNYLVPALGTVLLRDLRVRHVDAFLSELIRPERERPLSAATVRRIYATLRKALNDAVARRLIAYNPALHVHLPREWRDPVQVWTPEQVAHFLDAAEDDRLHALFHLVAMTGLRRGEVIGLRWSDVDLEQGSLHVAQAAVQFGGRVVIGPPKTRSGRRLVPLDALTVQVLRDHQRRQQQDRRHWGPAWQDTGLVFTREDGSLLSPELVSRRFRHISQQAGLPVIRFHDLRHTSASLALAAGVAMKVVSDRLGHSTTGITADLYTHVSPAVSRDAAEAIAATVRRRRDVIETLSRTPEPPLSEPADGR